MKIITASEMRRIDRRAMDEFGMAGEALMERAGEGLAAAIRRLAGMHQLVDSPVLFVAGCGNNGGDAFVAALSLYGDEAGPVEVWLAGSEQALKGDALVWFRRMKKAGVPFRALPEVSDWKEATVCGTDAEMVVDGLLGTGTEGAPRGVIAAAIDFVNAASERSLVVSIDMPSAMSVHADLTVTMGLPKEALVDPDYIDSVGTLEVVDLGFPEVVLDEAVGDKEMEFLHPEELAPCFPRRPRDCHKGDFGHLLCLGGSKGYAGAIAMASKAALRSGVGLVSTVVPEAIYALTAGLVPEAMVHTERPDHSFSAILAGPGSGRSEATRSQVLALLKHSQAPLVLDADAITVLAGDTSAIAAATCPVVLTPHPGELATLLGIKSDEVQEDRPAIARMAAKSLRAVVVLKGAGTLIASPDAPLVVNLNGNPGMASGGTGDILAGLVAGLIAQGLPVFGAACAAVWLHGRAGDLAAAEKAQACMIATDLLDKLPDAFRELSAR
jgi:ADP-dependent NAD(P)H-hydrate dehydratase / NAD(P)H-hydrate epimerase